MSRTVQYHHRELKSTSGEFVGNRRPTSRPETGWAISPCRQAVVKTWLTLWMDPTMNNRGLYLYDWMIRRISRSSLQPNYATQHDQNNKKQFWHRSVELRRGTICESSWTYPKVGIQSSRIYVAQKSSLSFVISSYSTNESKTGENLHFKLKFCNCVHVVSGKLE